MRRDDIDLHSVRPEHAAIHLSLLNWARCQRTGTRASSTLPMFRFYRDGYHEPTVAQEPPDELAGHKVQVVFASIPEKYRHAIGWAYVKPWIPIHYVCRTLAVRRSALADLIHDGRSMIKNRIR